MRILVAEDDGPLASFLATGLRAENYTVDIAIDGAQALELTATSNYDLIILDLGLPKIEGAAVLASIREKPSAIRVLILTGRTKLTDRVNLLDRGADDYLTKPFSFTELSARVRALLRRPGASPQTTLRLENLLLDRVNRAVERNGERISLTNREVRLLEYLMCNAGHCVTRPAIFEHVWNQSVGTTSNIVDIYVAYLRKKIDEGHALKLIHTVRGLGYQMEAKAHVVDP